MAATGRPPAHVRASFRTGGRLVPRSGGPDRHPQAPAVRRHRDVPCITGWRIGFRSVSAARWARSTSGASPARSAATWPAWSAPARTSGYRSFRAGRAGDHGARGGRRPPGVRRPRRRRHAARPPSAGRDHQRQRPARAAVVAFRRQRRSLARGSETPKPSPASRLEAVPTAVPRRNRTQDAPDPRGPKLQASNAAPTSSAPFEARGVRRWEPQPVAFTQPCTPGLIRLEPLPPHQLRAPPSWASIGGEAFRSVIDPRVRILDTGTPASCRACEAHPQYRTPKPNA